MSSVFFKVDDSTLLWENIMPDLSALEKFYLAINFCCVVSLLFLTIVISDIHRKGWADGRLDLEAMIAAVDDEQRAAMERKRLRRLQSRIQAREVAAAVDDPNLLHIKRMGLAADVRIEQDKEPSLVSEEDSTETETDTDDDNYEVPKHLQHVPYGGRQVHSDTDSD
jgi:hypothetical protein